MDIIEQFRAALAADPPEAESVTYDDRRCEITGNLVGTDTRPVGHPCKCASCSPKAKRWENSSAAN